MSSQHHRKQCIYPGNVHNQQNQKQGKRQVVPEPPQLNRCHTNALHHSHALLYQSKKNKEHYLNPFTNSSTSNVERSSVNYANCQDPTAATSNEEMSSLFLCCSSDIFSVLSSLKIERESDRTDFEDDLYFSNIGQRESRCLIDDPVQVNVSTGGRSHEHDAELRDTSFSSSSSESTMVASPISTDNTGVIFWKDLISSMQRRLRQKQDTIDIGSGLVDETCEGRHLPHVTGEWAARAEYQKSFAFTDSDQVSHVRNHKTEITQRSSKVEGINEYSEVKHIQQKSVEVVVLGNGVL